MSSVNITSASTSTTKGGNVTLSCNATALPGAQMTWKKGTVTLTTRDVYEVGAPTFSNENTNYKVAMTLKITANTSYVASSFKTCAVTDYAQGSTECTQIYECLVSNGGVVNSSNSDTIEVTVTGLQGMQANLEIDMMSPNKQSLAAAVFIHFPESNCYL